MTHQGTKTIQTKRLTLRQFVREDADAMFQNWASDPRVTRHLTWEPHASVDVTRKILDGWCALYANPAYYHWGIVYNGQLVGGISVVRQNEHDETAELGYCIGHDFWGLGITSEAAEAVIRYLIFEVGVHRVSIRHAVDNPASGRVAAKCGMRFEGILRGAGKVADGTFTDTAIYAILREDLA